MEVRTEENFNNCLFLRSLNVLVWSINTLWTESLNRRHRSCSSTTPCLRKSLETAGGSRMSLSAREGSSTRRKWRYAMTSFLWVNLKLVQQPDCLLVSPGKSTQLWCLVRLPSSGGEWCRPWHGQRRLWASHRQHPTHSGEETLETIHLPVDQLCSVWRAGSQGHT